MNLDVDELIDERNMRQGLAPRPSFLPPEQHKQIVERVCRMYRLLRDRLPSHNHAGEWDNYIDERRAYYDVFYKGDVEASASILQNFWRNDLGMIVKEYSDYAKLSQGLPEAHERFSRNVCRNYLIWREVYGSDPEALQMPLIGNPWGYMIDGRMIAPKATRHHACAMNAKNLASDRQHPVLCEIGGGFGGAAYYYIRDNHDSTYIDIDLPESLLLSAYYILCAFPQKKVFLFGEADSSVLNDLSSYSAVFLPPDGFDALADDSVDVLINTFSFSEMPMPVLERYFSLCDRKVSGYIWHNNMDRAGVVNRGYERIPSKQFPVNPNVWKLLLRHIDLFHGAAGDYMEYLYERRRAR